MTHLNVFRRCLLAAFLGLATLPLATRAASPGEAVPKRVLVAGATGGTGREVVREALAAGHAVRVLVRDEARAREIFGSGVEYAVGNVTDPASLQRAVQGIDYVVSALGSNTQNDPANKPEFVDYGGVKSLVEASVGAGVKHFVLVSSMGATHPDHMLNKMFDNILVWKLKGEDALRASGLRYTVVRPGGLRDSAGGQGGIRVMQGDPKDVRASIPRADVAAVCVRALGRPDADRKTFEIVSGDAGAKVDWSTFFSGLAADGR